PEGSQHVLTRHRDGSTNQLLRKGLLGILRKAGVSPWPKLFHNLRASRETELAASYPLHVVCAWIGNAERIAGKHYLQVTDADFERAAKSGADGAGKALQNPVQQDAATTRTEQQNGPNSLGERSILREDATCRKSLPDKQLTPTGFEP